MDEWQYNRWFEDIVKRKWNNYVITRSSLFTLKKKLKCLKQYWIIWNKEVFGDVKLNKENIITKINDLDKLDEESCLNEEKKKKRKQLFVELRNLSLR